MYVCFGGPSGAGKSTVARATKQRLEADGIRCAYYSPFFDTGRSIPYKLWWGMYLWTYFDWRLYRFFVWESGGRWFWRRRLKHWLWPSYKSLILSYYLAQVRKGNVDVLMYDEDVLKWRAMAVARGILSEEVIHNLYQESIVNVTKQAVLTSVAVPPDVAADRFVRRDEPNADKQRKEQLVKKSEEHTAAVLDLGESVAACTDAEHIVLDGTRPPRDNAEILAAKVREAMCVDGVEDSDTTTSEEILPRQ